MDGLFLARSLNGEESLEKLLNLHTYYHQNQINSSLSNTKHKLFSLAEVCALPSALPVFTREHVWLHPCYRGSIHWDQTPCRALLLPKQSPWLLGTILDGSPLRHSIPASWHSFCRSRKDDRQRQPRLGVIPQLSGL